MKLFKALIADDEPAARRILLSMLSSHTNSVEIIGEAKNGVEALAMINEKKPELVFLDIQMPGYTGFEVLQKISYQPNIIFTTAYEEHALKAFETFSVDYLLKPIRQERLDAAIEKLKNFGCTAPKQGDLINLIPDQRQKIPSAFPIKLGDRILLFKYESISHFEADDKYVALIAMDGKRHFTDNTLGGLLAKLPSNFIRVQKSYIINKEKIKEIHKHFNGRFVIVMDNATQSRIVSGLTFFEAIKTELGI